MWRRQSSGPAIERTGRLSRGSERRDFVKLDHALVKYLPYAIEPGFDTRPPDMFDWRTLVTPRLQRMWNEIPLEVRCALVESYQKLAIDSPA
jgi:hypothetical protein